MHSLRLDILKLTTVTHNQGIDICRGFLCWFHDIVCLTDTDKCYPVRIAFVVLFLYVSIIISMLLFQILLRLFCNKYFSGVYFRRERSDGRSSLQVRLETGGEKNASKTQHKHKRFYVKTLNWEKSRGEGGTSL